MIMNEQQPTIKYVDINWLKTNLNNHICILDCQPEVYDYIREHIQGAVYFNENHLRTYMSKLPTWFVPENVLNTLLEETGVQPSVPVVVYSGKGRFSKTGDGLGQTMLAYSLIRYGCQEVYILDGGIDSWIEAGFELEKQYPTVKKGTFTAKVRNSLFLKYNQFLEMKDNKNTHIIDVRPEAIYQHKGIWSKPGHIPGAINVPWHDFMDKDNLCKLKPIHHVKEIALSHNIKKDNTIIVYCGTGREATAGFIVFKYILNFPDVRLYEGSFTEWCTIPENPTVTGPEPF
jgi:thiosulfate/3-mercaptopyruvate sulfurtransferase